MGAARHDRIGGLGGAAIFAAYIALFLDRGMASPFAPLWFRDHGFSSAAIAAALAAPQLARVVTGPLIGLLAQKLAHLRTGVALVTAATAGAFLTMAAGGSPLLASAAWFVASTTSSASLPLIDVVALRAAARGGPHYGAYRSVGTAAYLGANLAGGALLRALGSAIVPFWSLTASLAGLLSAPALPRDAPEAEGAPPARRALEGLRVLMRTPGFLVLLAAVGLIDASHVYFYGFSALLWRARGLDGFTIGALWALCALAEVLFLAFGEPLRRRLGPWRLLLAGAVVATLRWLGLSLDPPVWALALLQIAHAGSFSATFTAALALVERQLGTALSPLGQSVCAAIANGFLVGLATLACGVLYSRLGVTGYLPMAFLSGCAVIIALWGRRRLVA